MIDIIHSDYSLPESIGFASQWAENYGDQDLGENLESNGCSTYHYTVNENVLDLGTEAITKTLEATNVSAAEVDVVILFQTSPCNAFPMPNTLVGSLKQRASLSRAWALSITQQQCVSPIHALRVLNSLFDKHPKWKYALLVGIDTILQENLRAIGNSGIHSDAASAMLIGREGSGSRVVTLDTYNDPRASVGINADGTYGENTNYLWSLISLIRKLFKRSGVDANQCISILPHNVNRPAWGQALDAMRLPQSVLFDQNFSKIGHAFGSDAAINIKDSSALVNPGNHLVFASGIGGCFGGFILQTGKAQ